ncbi:zinc metalloproteinase nas-13-like [Xenia sp. Carnegie-2017]|uniref:zinc metalloproteinase nas-13-like n=1 Tax=Xenia sp. Carnegie-2017 TaxID=2897299 RepID=UPI001F03486E|nr:zinc metalloproteinase nas-13-like [Xenia sp. Carnegie-2017]
MILYVISLTFLLGATMTKAQSIAGSDIGDDQSNWAEILKHMRNSTDGRQEVDDSMKPTIFDIIINANAHARSKPIQRSEEDKFLFQGDIAMPPIDVMKTLRNRRRKRAVMRKISTGSNLWQTHKLAYIFRNDLGQYAKSVIRAAIKAWEETLPCLGKWKDVTNVDASKRPRDYIYFIKGEGCYSQVGRRGGRQTISIGKGCDHIGVVIHEIGHAMGFWHEQSRTDRDSYVTIHWENIIPAMRFNFGKYSSSKINDLGVGYDYNSVMHYGSRAFSKDGRSSTITIKGNNPGNVRLGQRYRLSKLDKKQAQLLYSCDCIDNDKNCDSWGKQGYCNPKKGFESFMKKNCCATCRKQTAAVKSCSSSPCFNLGVCKDVGNSYSCNCPAGYNGKQCERKVLPCNSSPCLNSGTCSNNGNKFSCTCSSLYTGERCERRKIGAMCASDLNTNCKQWEKYCVMYAENEYQLFMKNNCCQTCKQFCKDKNQNCKQWKSNGFCTHKIFEAYMRNNCVVACGHKCTS